MNSEQKTAARTLVRWMTVLAIVAALAINIGQWKQCGMLAAGPAECLLRLLIPWVGILLVLWQGRRLLQRSLREEGLDGEEKANKEAAPR